VRLSLSGRIAANSVVQIVGNALATLISLFTFAAMVRALGPSSFGNFAAATAFLAIPALFFLGLGWTVLREISQHPARLHRLMGVSVVARCLAAVPILLLAVAIALLLPFDSQVHYAVAVGALGGFCAMADAALMPAMQVRLRMEWVMVTTVLSGLLRLGLVLGLINAGYGFHEIVWAYAAGNAANLLLDIVVVRRIAGIRLIFDLRYGWTLLRGSILLGIAMTISSAYWYVDRVLLALLRPSADVGLYSAAFKYAELSFVAVGAISFSIFPELARTIAQGQRERISYLLQWSVDIMLLVSVPLCAFSLIYAQRFLQLAAGDDFTRAAAALQVVGFLVLVVFLSAPFERALIAGHRERLLAVLNGAALLINIVLNVIFIPLYGYMGLAVVSLVTAVMWLAAAAFFTRRLYAFTPRLRFAALVLLAGVAMAAILALAPISPVAAGAVALVVYGLMVTLPAGTGREVTRRILRDVRRPRHVTPHESHPGTP
jgi:O-antigen/teichoic acid export membrane protein